VGNLWATFFSFFTKRLPINNQINVVEMVDQKQQNETFLAIGKRLIGLREKHGMTLTVATEKLKIKRPTYEKYEYGLSKPNPSNLKKITDFYGCSVGWLLAGEGVAYPDSPDAGPAKVIEPQRDLPPGSFDKFMDEIKRSRELNHAISELIVSKRQGGFDNVLFKTIYDVMREFLNKNGRQDLNSNDFGFANVIQVIYRELKRTPGKEELMSLISTLYALGKVFPYGVPLTPHEQMELFSWGRLPAPEENIGG
jgi:transcriptional regulator with XRE-family HTH domain